MRDQLFLLYNGSFCTDHTLKEQLWWSLYVLTAVKFYVCDVTFLNDSHVNYVRKFTLFYITVLSRFYDSNTASDERQQHEILHSVII